MRSDHLAKHVRTHQGKLDPVTVRMIAEAAENGGEGLERFLAERANNGVMMGAVAATAGAADDSDDSDVGEDEPAPTIPS